VNNNLVRGTKDFSQILTFTELSVHPDEFVLVGLSPKRQMQLEATLSRLTGDFVQYIREPDILTLLLPQSSWKVIEQDYPEAHLQSPINLFTFSVAMDWDVVGFLAGVTILLAKNDIPLGAVCGYYRDHLFIARQYAKQAEAILRQEISHHRKPGSEG
jgi:hypothetical protein